MAACKAVEEIRFKAHHQLSLILAPVGMTRKKRDDKKKGLRYGRDDKGNRSSDDRKRGLPTAIHLHTPSSPTNNFPIQ
jgi:hypothetical protein